MVDVVSSRMTDTMLTMLIDHYNSSLPEQYRLISNFRDYETVRELHDFTLIPIESFEREEVV